MLRPHPWRNLITNLARDLTAVIIATPTALAERLTASARRTEDEREQTLQHGLALGLDRQTIDHAITATSRMITPDWQTTRDMLTLIAKEPPTHHDKTHRARGGKPSQIGS